MFAMFCSLRGGLGQAHLLPGLQGALASAGRWQLVLSCLAANTQLGGGAAAGGDPRPPGEAGHGQGAGVGGDRGGGGAAGPGPAPRPAPGRWLRHDHSLELRPAAIIAGVSWLLAPDTAKCFQSSKKFCLIWKI